MRFRFSTDEPAEKPMSWADETQELPREFEMPHERPSAISFRPRANHEERDHVDTRRRRSAYGRDDRAGFDPKRLVIAAVAVAVAVVIGITGWTISADHAAMAAGAAAARTVAAAPAKAKKHKKHKKTKKSKKSSSSKQVASNS
jgi:hypothetical protein